MSTHVIRSKGSLPCYAGDYQHILECCVRDARRMSFPEARDLASAMSRDNYTQYIAIPDPARIRLVCGKGQRRNRRRA